MRRRNLALALLAAPWCVRADGFDGDPYQSGVWIDLRREYLGGAKAVYDPRVQVEGPAR